VVVCLVVVGDRARSYFGEDRDHSDFEEDMDRFDFEAGMFEVDMDRFVVGDKVVVGLSLGLD